jgi:hypothetical protein
LIVSQADESITTFTIEGEDKLDTSHLAKQDLATLDPSKLTPLSPEVISRQATINIGTIGHVAHGKSTVVKAISGVQVPSPPPSTRHHFFPHDQICV